MKTFGIISEGPTDQIIIENILVGFFNNDDLSPNIRQLQPLRDTTDAVETQRFGGWYKVFEYCSSTNFIEAFEQNDYLIIQVDTDRCEDEHYDIKRTNVHGATLTDEDLIQAVIDKFERLLVTTFGQEKFNLFNDRIIYAVSVEEIECWLLPLYYDSKIKASTGNCVHKLNEGIKGKFTFYIDPGNKSNMVNNYDKMSRPFTKSKILTRKYVDNISLQVFVEKLTEKNITI